MGDLGGKVSQKTTVQPWGKVLWFSMKANTQYIFELFSDTKTPSR